MDIYKINIISNCMASLTIHNFELFGVIKEIFLKNMVINHDIILLDIAKNMCKLRYNDKEFWMNFIYFLNKNSEYNILQKILIFLQKDSIS